MQPVYMVYWSEAEPSPDATSGDSAKVSALPPAIGWSPHARAFDASSLAEALAFAETLRRRQADGERVAFVTLCSENPNSVGRAGAADPPADYAWKKRRP